VRLKPGSAGADYDCEYSGYFQSGVTVGPLRNGAPCRSTVANDPLEGLQVRLVRRTPPAEVLPEKPKPESTSRRAAQVSDDPPPRKASSAARTTRRS
jgi:hypothetical protein